MFGSVKLGVLTCFDQAPIIGFIKVHNLIEQYIHGESVKIYAELHLRICCFLDSQTPIVHCT